MATPQRLEQRMNAYFYATIGVAIALPLLCIGPIVMLEGDSGLHLAFAAVFICFGAIFAFAVAGSRQSKRLGKLPIRERFWLPEYDASFSEKEFLVAPLVGYHATQIQLQDLAGRVLACVPRRTQVPLRAVEFAINGQSYEIRKRSNHQTREIDIRPSGASNTLIKSVSPNRQKASYEVRVRDELCILVVPESGKMFPTRSSLFVDDECVGMMHVHEKILFKGLVLFLPQDWPEDLRLLLAAFFWADRGR